MKLEAEETEDDPDDSDLSKFLHTLIADRAVPQRLRSHAKLLAAKFETVHSSSSEAEDEGGDACFVQLADMQAENADTLYYDIAAADPYSTTQTGDVGVSAASTKAATLKKDNQNRKVRHNLINKEGEDVFVLATSSKALPSPSLGSGLFGSWRRQTEANRSRLFNWRRRRTTSCSTLVAIGPARRQRCSMAAQRI